MKILNRTIWKNCHVSYLRHTISYWRRQVESFIHVSLFIAFGNYFPLTFPYLSCVQSPILLSPVLLPFFLFPASGGFMLYVMFAATFVHILCFVSFVSYFRFVKYKSFKLLNTYSLIPHIYSCNKTNYLSTFNITK